MKKLVALMLAMLLLLSTVVVGSAEAAADGDSETVIFESKMMAILAKDIALSEFLVEKDTRALLACIMMTEYLMEVPDANVETLPVYIGTTTQDDILFAITAFAVTVDGTKTYLQVMCSDRSSDMAYVYLSTEDSAIMDAVMDAVCETHWDVEFADLGKAANDLQEIISQ